MHQMTCCTEVCLTIFMLALLMSATEAVHAPVAGVLKMCPPGGETFATAWQLTCGMRKKREVSEQNGEHRSKRNNDYRPLSLTEMMHYCCQFGCTFRDLLPYCDPFGGWDS